MTKATSKLDTDHVAKLRALAISLAVDLSVYSRADAAFSSCGFAPAP
jgi:hypothetical protein